MQAQKDLFRIKSKRLIIPTLDKNVEQLELSHTVGWNIVYKMLEPLWNMAVSSKVNIYTPYDQQ